MGSFWPLLQRSNVRKAFRILLVWFFFVSFAIHFSRWVFSFTSSSVLLEIHRYQDLVQWTHSYVHMHWIQYIIWITFTLIFNYIVFIYRDMKMMWTLSIDYHKTPNQNEQMEEPQTRQKQTDFNNGFIRQWKSIRNNTSMWFCFEPFLFSVSVFLAAKKTKIFEWRQKKPKRKKRLSVSIHCFSLARTNDSQVFFSFVSYVLH